jgi:pimeloyl-ACP methyl ester carboxylesterase
MPVETEVREGIYFSAVTLTQPDIPSGVGVTLPSVSADGTVLYTYDGNILSFTAAIESDAEIFFPLRVEVQDTADDAVLASVDVTAPNATTASVTLAWDTFNTAWASDGTMLGARNIVVRLLDEAGETLDSANFTLTVRPRPVVLVHGWNSTEGMWSSYAGYLSSAADGWLGLPANNLSTGGGGRPFHDAKWNADKLHEFVTEQRETLDAAHIDLVGHSMGGLIGRAYLQAHGERDVDGQPVALRLITLGTPNTGSPCGNVGAVLSVFSSQLDGAWHFTPAYMRTFNQTVTDTHGTMIHALAGTSVWTCGIEGDGVVPVNSATAYGLDNKISVFTAHIPGVEIWERVFGARDFEYSETQFNEFVIGQLRAAWTPDAPLRLDAQVATAEESDAPPVTQRYTLTIPAGSLAVMTVNAFDGEDLGVLIAPVSGITAELRAPDGAVLVSLDQDDMESLPMGILPHEDATAGTYTVHFANTGTQTATIEMVVFESGLSYVLEIDILPQPDGKTLITATVLQNGTPIPNVSIVAHLDRIEDEESAQPYDLTDGAEEVIGVSADGVHTALLDLPAGVYALAVKAQTNRYSLTESHTFTVADAETGD